ARAGDPAAGRADALRARRWFVANDDLVGLGAAEVALAAIALTEADTATARAHLEAVVSALGNLGSSHQEAWTLTALATISAEQEEAVAARRWLRLARRQFELLGVDAGCRRCDELELTKELQSGV
ncbi:MAG TPA: hypothetical protein VGI73_12335, partial [Solirubrobacterales bacterium]